MIKENNNINNGKRKQQKTAQITITSAMNKENNNINNEQGIQK